MSPSCLLFTFVLSMIDLPSLYFCDASSAHICSASASQKSSNSAQTCKCPASELAAHVHCWVALPTSLACIMQRLSTHVRPSHQLHAAITIQVADCVKSCCHGTLLLCSRDNIRHRTEQVRLPSAGVEVLQQQNPNSQSKRLAEG